MEGSVHDRVVAEGGVGCERTDGVTLGVIRSRHPSVGGGRNRLTSPSALEDSSLILLCQLSHSAGYCFIQHVSCDFPNHTLKKSSFMSKMCLEFCANVHLNVLWTYNLVCLISSHHCRLVVNTMQTY